MSVEQDLARRFAGVEKLYGADGLRRFSQSHVVVAGVGGVGSWTVESLARSGIGKLTLIDLDHISESNINRQLHSLDPTLGQAKVLALQTRIALINAQCEVHCIEEFITVDNTGSLLDACMQASHTLLIDCIDHAKTKAALIALCRQRKWPVLTVGAAGACIDPLRIRIGDLSNTQNDLLLARTRKHLRQQHGFARNPKRSFCVPAVYSDEARLANQSGEVQQGDLNCAGYGSVVHVTASMGFTAAGKALEILLH